MDPLQGCYKDGTEPNSFDFRWPSAMSFIILPLTVSNVELFLFISHDLLTNLTIHVAHEIWLPSKQPLKFN